MQLRDNFTRQVTNPVFTKDGKEYKKCIKCKRELPTTCFRTKSAYTNTLIARCKDCLKEAQLASKARKQARKKAKLLSIKNDN